MQRKHFVKQIVLCDFQKEDVELSLVHEKQHCLSPLPQFFFTNVILLGLPSCETI